MPFPLKASVLVLLLVIILVLHRNNKRDPKPLRRFAMLMVSILTVLFCVLEPVFANFWGKKNQLNNLSLRAQALRIGQTASSLKPGIKSVIVIVDKKAIGTRSHEKQLESLIEGIKAFALDLRVYAAKNDGPEISGGEFASILKQSQKVDLIVSFIGLPGSEDIDKVPRFIFEEAEAGEEAENSPVPMIAVALPMLDNYAARLLKNGRIDMISVNRVDMLKVNALTEKSSLKEYYDALYVMLTGGNLIQEVKAHPSLLNLGGLESAAEKAVAGKDEEVDKSPEVLLDVAVPMKLPTPKIQPEKE